MKLGIILLTLMISAASFANESNKHDEPSCMDMQNTGTIHNVNCSDESIPDNELNRNDFGLNENKNIKLFSSEPDILINSYEDIGLEKINIKGRMINKSRINNLSVNGEVIEYDKSNGYFDTNISTSIDGKYNFNLFSNETLIKELSYFKNGTLNEKMIINVDNEGVYFFTNAIKNKVNEDPSFIGKTLVSLINPLLKNPFIHLEFNNLDFSIKDIKLTPLDDNIIEINLIASNLYFSFNVLPFNGFSFTLKGNAGPIEIKSTMDLNNEKGFSTQSINIQTVIIEKQDLPGIEIGAAITSSWLRILINKTYQNEIIKYLDLALNENLDPLISDILNGTYSLNINADKNIHEIDFNLTEAKMRSTKNDLSLYASLNSVSKTPEKETLIRLNKSEISNIKTHDYNLLMNSNIINEILYTFYSGDIFNLTTSKSDFILGKDVFENTDTAKIDFLTLPWIAFNSNNNSETIEVNADEVQIHIRMNNIKLNEILNDSDLIKEININDLLSDPKGTTLISATLSVKLSMHIELKDSKLDLSLNGINKIKIKTLKIGSQNVNETILHLFDPYLSVIVVTEVNAMLDTIINSFELPDFNCLALKDVNINNGKDNHFNVGINLKKTSDICDIDYIPSPRVFYGRSLGIIPTHCKDGDENDAGLCYPKCKSGFSGLGPLCWNDLKEYGRGVGKIPTDCGNGRERNGGLCYPVCKKDYHGIGPVCWANKSKSYGRGIGTFPLNIFTGYCPSGKENNAGLCYRKCDSGYRGVGPVCWLNNPSYGRGVGRIANQCEPNKENDAGLCYPKCKAEYNGIGPMCWQKEISYGRNVGKMPICPPTQEKDAGLCYIPCLKGYKGIGPACHRTG